MIAYLNEHDDAKETQRLVQEAGRRAVLVAGDLGASKHCRAIIDKAMAELGGIDILVNNAADRATFKSIEDISDEEWELTFRVNIHAMFYLTKAAVPHMKEGGAIINTASINADKPNPTLLAYAMTKGAIQNFTAGLAQLLAEKGIRANTVAPGPIWTPLIPSTIAKKLSKSSARTCRRNGRDNRPSLRRPTYAGRYALKLCVGRDHRRELREADSLGHFVKRGSPEHTHAHTAWGASAVRRKMARLRAPC